MKKSLLVMKAEIVKQQRHDYHSPFVWCSLLVWPVLGFFEVYYAYKPFELSGYMGIAGSRELLAFLGTGFMAYTCFWSMVQNAWSMAGNERRSGTLEVAYLSPANRLAMSYGKALGALLQEVWMFSAFCIFILLYTGALGAGNILLLVPVLLLLVLSSMVWGGMLNVIFLFSRDASIVMDVFDMPMTLFSGVRAPLGAFPVWARLISLFFPLTYCIQILRFAFGVSEGNGWAPAFAGLIVCLAVMSGITLALIWQAEKHNRENGELQFY